MSLVPCPLAWCVSTCMTSSARSAPSRSRCAHRTITISIIYTQLAHPVCAGWSRKKESLIVRMLSCWLDPRLYHRGALRTCAQDTTEVAHPLCAGWSHKKKFRLFGCLLNSQIRTFTTEVRPGRVLRMISSLMTSGTPSSQGAPGLDNVHADTADVQMSTNTPSVCCLFAQDRVSDCLGAFQSSVTSWGSDPSLETRLQGVHCRSTVSAPPTPHRQSICACTRQQPASGSALGKPWGSTWTQRWVRVRPTSRGERHQDCPCGRQLLPCNELHIEVPPDHCAM